MPKTRQNEARVSSNFLFFQQWYCPIVNAQNSLSKVCFWGRDCHRQNCERRKCCMVNVSAVGQVFKCEICGNVVVVKEAGGGELICCGEPMILESE
jgi:desulfoferrodoxin-like iron-binding protein